MRRRTDARKEAVSGGRRRDATPATGTPLLGGEKLHRRPRYYPSYHLRLRLRLPPSGETTTTVPGGRRNSDRPSRFSCGGRPRRKRHCRRLVRAACDGPTNRSRRRTSSGYTRPGRARTGGIGTGPRGGRSGSRGGGATSEDEMTSSWERLGVGVGAKNKTTRYLTQKNFVSL